MKKVFVAVLLVVGMTTFAQNGRTQKERVTPEQQVELQAKKMKLDLDLNDKQAVEIKKIMAEQSKKREAKRAEREAKKAKDVKPTADEMFQIKSQMLDEQIALKSEMKKVLTPEQFTKWEKIHADRKAEAKGRIGKRHQSRK
jgi:Spy/CpxP family protein refolding chaperone